jgi:hypothetical protein
MRAGACLAMLGLVGTLVASQAQAEEFTTGAGLAPKGPLNTLRDVQQAIVGCWKWPPGDRIRTGLDFTVLLSFRRNGEVFGARITYQSKNVSPEEREVYYGALMEAITICSPLPVSASLGEAIAGRPFAFRFHDTRKERKA